MKRRLFGRRLRRDAVRVTGIGLVYFAAAMLAMFISRESGHISSIWIANALTIAFALRLRPQLWPAALAAAFAGGMLANLAGGQDSSTALVLMIINLIDVAAGLLALQVIGLGQSGRTTAADIIRTVALAGAAMPAITGGIGAAYMQMANGAPFSQTYLSWWSGSLAGAAMVLPIALLSTRRDWGALAASGVRWPVLGYAAFCAGTSLLAYVAFPYPFVIACAPLLLAAARVPVLGTALIAATNIVVLIAVSMTNTWALSGAPSLSTLISTQVAATVTALVPVVLGMIVQELRDERARLAASVASHQKLVNRIADYALYTIDRQGNILTWNRNAARLKGYSTEEIAGRNYSVFFTQEDREAGVPEQELEAAARDGRLETDGWRVRKDGSTFWAHVSMEAIRDARGEVVGFGKVARDQTELRSSQAALLASEQRWGFALGSAGQGAWDYDMVGRKLHLSADWLDMLGLDAGGMEWTLAAWRALIHPDDRAAAVLPDAADSIAADGYGESEYRMRHADGRDVWILSRMRVADRSTDGAPVRVIGTHTDISSRKQIEMALKAAEARWKWALESSSQGVWDQDLEHGRTYYSPTWKSMLGYLEDELAESADLWIQLMHPDDVDRAKQADEDHLAGRTEYYECEFRMRHRDGRWVWVNDRGRVIERAPDGRPLRMIGTHADITARKEAEAALAASEERYRMMADHFTDLVVQMDLNLTRTYVSPASKDLIGLAPEAMIGRSPMHLVHPEDAERVKAAFDRVLSGSDRGALSARYRHRDGHWVWVDASLRLMRDPHTGQPASILIVSRDVSRAKVAEQALRASEETFRAAMELASIGMALNDLAGRWISVNPALCQILGYDREELMQTNFLMLSHPEDMKLDVEQQFRLLAEEISSYQIEKRYLHRSGRTIWTQQSVSLARNADGTPRHLIIQLQDITERKEVDRLKSEFISMVSHELRTPLTSIRGSLGLVLGTMAADLSPRAAQLVDIAHKNSERLIPLVNDILDLDKLNAGLMRLDMREETLCTLIGQAVESTQPYAERYGVSIVAEEGPQIAIRTDAGRMIQVLTNLISNAVKFSPEGAEVVVNASVRDGRAHIEVRDCGPGIAEAFRPRIFSRFSQADSATTRQKGGSGLGLHISRQLVELMGGTIGFESEVDVGTVFWVELPVSSEASQPLSDAAEAMPERAPEALVCHPDPATAALLAAALERLGVVAIEASDVDGVRHRLAEGGIVLVVLDASEPASEVATAVAQDIAAHPAGNVGVVLVGNAVPAAALKRFDAFERAPFWTIDPNDIEGLTRIVRKRLRADDAVPRILHVEDESDLSALLATALHGIAEVVNAPGIELGRRLLMSEPFDLLVLDRSLPDGDGLSLLSRQASWRSIPVVVLSGAELSADPEGVAAHLVKSRVSEAKVAATIATLLDRRRADIRRLPRAG